MALFLSTYTNKVDAKGRVSVPAAHRSAVMASGFEGVVLYPSVKFDCLEGASLPEFEKLIASIDSQFSPFDEQSDALAEILAAQAAPLAFDGDGRILMPEELRRHAGIRDQASFVGMGRRFRVWEPQAFEIHKTDLKQRAAAAADAVKRPGAVAPSQPIGGAKSLNPDASPDPRPGGGGGR